MFILKFQGHLSGHVIYSNIFEFSELEIVSNNTNLNVLSHLIRKISRLTDNDND